MTHQKKKRHKTQHYWNSKLINFLRFSEFPEIKQNIVTSSTIDENAVKYIGLSSSKWLGHRPQKLGDVGSSSTGNDILRVFGVYLQIYEKKKIPEIIQKLEF